MTELTETVRMTYRQLAEHFGIGLDSARIKAQRHIRAGRWKLLPGNYPGSLVVVELPVEYLKVQVKPSGRQARSGHRPPSAQPSSISTLPSSALSFDATLLGEFRDELQRFRTDLEQERAARVTERDDWRTIIEQFESNHLAELERLQADRQAERERIRELVGKLIEDTAARDLELRERAELAERRAEFAGAATVQAQAEAASARERADRLVAQVERLTSALDRVHKDRQAEVEEFAALSAERDTLVAEVKRLRQPWWKRLFRSM